MQRGVRRGRQSVRRYTQCMIYVYIRVSTDKQTTENQRFEILKYADEKKLPIDTWIEETISATKKLSHRKLGALLAAMQPEDVLLVTELSRLGRSLLEVMSILHIKSVGVCLFALR